jgi:dUTP pyrophosphatase
VGCVDNEALSPTSVTMGRTLRFAEAVMAMEHENAVRIKVMKLHAEAQLPRYAHTGPSGDLAADLYAVADATLAPGATMPVATGVAMEFPATHGALVEDRSGLAVRGVTTLAGVIDPGYRGEIKVVMTNLSATAVEIKAGDRIAQLRIVRRIEAEFEEVTELVEAARGAKGFGSTGK